MKFYTDVNIFKNNILLRGYENNERIHETIPYKPYLFIKSNKESEYKNIYGDSLSKIDFDSIYQAKQFRNSYKQTANFEIYGMDRFVYPFISDNYTGTIHYDASLIKIMYIDIEVDTENGFPDIEAANRHITAITYRIGNTRTVLGLKDFDKNKLQRITDAKNIHYYKFKTEKELLKSFIQLWQAADIDVVTGWNIELFDIPYIVRRIRQVLGENESKKLSPWKKLRERTIKSRGKEHVVFFPIGIAILDYFQLYKKFTYSQRESYSLNYISHVELGVAKLDYSEYENLAALYRENHQLFIEYNIIDVDLVCQLEDKLRLIELVYAISYDAKVNYNDALGSVLLWDVIIMNYLKDKNIIINPKTSNNKRDFEGGYVKNPILGMHEWVLSFDLTSLYPHLIMQYNISPETYVKSVNMSSYYRTNNSNFVDHILEKRDMPTVEDCTIAANGCVYRKDTYGFLPALMDLQFKLRNDYKDLMKESKKKFIETKEEKYEKEISRWNNAQMAKKIQLNSLYGSLSNEHFRWYNANHAEAITLSGQLSIRWIAKEVNQYVQSILKTKEDYIIAIDTDSIYVNFGPIIKALSPKNPIDFLDKLAKKKIEPFIQEKYIELAKLSNAYENKMFMKREAIADKVIWRAKKNYIANVWDNEGIRFKEPELKMMGIETVRSSTPEICRNKIKEIIRLILYTDEATVQKFIETFKKEYYSLPFEDIAFPRSVKKLSKYADEDRIYKLRTPINSKAALLYNNYLKKSDFKNKYNEIYESDKIKYVYLIEPNHLMNSVIGAPNILPKEFDLDKYIDYKTMFEKSFLEPVTSILDVIGWKAKKVPTLKFKKKS